MSESAGAHRTGSAWTSEENAATAEAYFESWLGDLDGCVTKMDCYRMLHRRFPWRSEKRFEYKFQNVSGVLWDEGLQFLEGLKPRVNYQQALKTEVLAFLSERPDLAAAIGPAVATDVTD